MIPMVLNKKALKLVVCMSLIVALAISALALSVGATYENTHYNSGDQAQDIVGVAQTQVGYSEGSSGYTKYGDWYGLPNSDWCAMFVSWCAAQAGVDSNVFPTFALCSAGCDWFISQGRFNYSGSYIPQAGDLIFYSSYGNIYHVGLVTGSDGTNVYSIEGNYTDKVSNVSYPLSYGDILGYATPNYSYSDGDQNSYVPDYGTESTVEDIDEYNNVYVESDNELTEDEPVVESEAAEETDDEFVDSEADVDTELEGSEELLTDIDEDSELDTDDVLDTDSDLVTEDEQFLTGDVNGDGYVSSMDAFIIRRYLAEVGDLDDAQFLRADTDGSGIVDIYDVITILEISVG